MMVVVLMVTESLSWLSYIDITDLLLQHQVDTLGLRVGTRAYTAGIWVVVCVWMHPSSLGPKRQPKNSPSVVIIHLICIITRAHVLVDRNNSTLLPVSKARPPPVWGVRFSTESRRGRKRSAISTPNQALTDDPGHGSKQRRGGSAVTFLP